MGAGEVDCLAGNGTTLQMSMDNSGEMIPDGAGPGYLVLLHTQILPQPGYITDPSGMAH